MVGRAIAVDAAVLATAIRVDRPVERDVRALVARDDASAAARSRPRSDRRQRLVDVPAVVHRDVLEALEAAGHVQPRPPRPPHRRRHRLDSSPIMRRV